MSEEEKKLVSIRPEIYLFARPHLCHSLACKHCRVGRAIQLQKNLNLAFQHGFDTGLLYMITFTTGRELPAKETFLLAQKERLLSRCIRAIRHKFGDLDWFAIGEFQEGGYHHWHVLICFPRKLEFYKDGADYKLFQRIHKIWHVGSHINFEYMQNISSACRYVTKYIAPTDDKHEVPEWVFELKNFRFYTTSRGFWIKYGVSENSSRNEDIKKDEECESVSCSRTLGQIVADCGKYTDLYGPDGSYFMTCAMPFRMLARFGDNCPKVSLQDPKRGYLKECVCIPYEIGRVMSGLYPGEPVDYTLFDGCKADWVHRLNEMEGYFYA